ncbi:tigger transposable element-derived protein 7-like [Procambarus clarkii]|uniref:tigger transposable element-derived protein 7-like n=1 Tax=Procambarus clarkii TaxID=6728 RepID=UPI0037447C06
MRSEGSVAGRKINKGTLSAMMCANDDGIDRITCAIVGDLSYFLDVFCKEVRDQVKKLKVRPSKVQAVLLRDNAPAHPKIDTLTSHDGKITCMALSPNTTSLIQPMDQGVICATKRLYKKMMLNKVLVVLPIEEDMELSVDNRVKRTLENLKNYSIKEAIYNWAKVWSEVKELTLKNSWKKKLMSTVSNEDEERNFEGFTDEIHEMFRNVGKNLG